MGKVQLPGHGQHGTKPRAAAIANMASFGRREKTV